MFKPYARLFCRVTERPRLTEPDRWWEKLSGRLLFEEHAFVLKEVDGVLNGKAAENISDDRFGTGVVVTLGHRMVGDVASATAGDQNFGSDFFAPSRSKTSRPRRAAWMAAKRPAAASSNHHDLSLAARHG